jgi:hypothetical protein
MKQRSVNIAALAFCTGVLLSILPVARSQEGPGGSDKVEKVAQVLNLSPQQKSQLAPILEAEAPKVKAITGDPNLSGPEKVKRLKAVHSQTDPLVKSILNPTQYKQWETIRKDELDKLKSGG